jgi:uncharacterized protein
MNRNPTLSYVAPFAIFVGFLGLDRLISLPAEWFYPIRLLAVAAALFTISRPYWSLRASMPLASIGVGVAVFLIWIAPDVLFGAGYRHFWLFENPITGAAKSSLAQGLTVSTSFILLRSFGSTAVVPILEELFWRGWMMRWLVDTEFLKVPLGKYVPSAFWLVAVLFASEHGPYWEVGLAAGIIYNWWMVRTRNLADCIWAHAVTNGLLAIYVVVYHQWQYWL